MAWGCCGALLVVVALLLFVDGAAAAAAALRLMLCVCYNVRPQQSHPPPPNNSWDSGETYLLADQSMRAVVDKLAEGLTIVTGLPITRVEHGPGGVTLRTACGRALRARAAVITASLGVLQSGKVEFAPPLPEAKRAAISRLRMGNAAKVVCAFSRRFWPDDLYDVCCTGAFAPEIWSTQHAPVPGAPGEGLHAMVGFLAGARAAKVAEIGDAAAARLFVEQLDEMFGSPDCPRPATDSLVRYVVHDWAKEEWVRGAYSFPSLGAEAGDREALAAPVGGSLFFAGEAAHPDVNPCMQAALDTGGRAAAAALAALRPAALRSKL